MSQETDVLLRTILFQVMNAKREGKTFDDMISAIRVMCSKDIIDAVEQEMNALNKAEE